MNKDTQQLLYDKYSKIFAQKDLPKGKSNMYYGVSCGDGWYDILDVLCGQIKNNTESFAGFEIKFEACQIKEKFGSLRFYYDLQFENNFPELIELRIKAKISGLVEMAEAISHHICEGCGAPGYKNTERWIKTMCDNCHEKRLNTINE